jgi:hypothetical protein
VQSKEGNFMKVKSWIFALLIAAGPMAMAQSSATTSAAPDDHSAVEEQGAPDASEATAPSDEELAGKIEAQTEAFTELKNVVDALAKLKISGYIQAQYVDDESSVNELSSATATKNRNQFSIRRGRVKFVYQATPWARFTIQPDISTAATPVVLKDGFVELIEQRTSWHHTLTAGQFNWPFGFEIAYSSSDREMPERTRVIRTLFPGERDRGVQMSAVSPNNLFSYKVAIVNGTGTNAAFDFNEDKDLVGRVGLNLGKVDVGVSGYNGTDLVFATATPQGVEFDKTRYGADFQLITPVPGLLTRGEYIVGEERGADVKGWYLYLVQNIGTRHQLVLRGDEYDPNTDTPDNAIFTLGGSYIFHWDSNSKVMFAYEHPKTQKIDPKDNITTIRFQYKF